MNIILNKINGKSYKVLSGVDLGTDARKSFNLDAIDSSKESVTISIPDDVISVNSSFFSGLFQIGRAHV